MLDCVKIAAALGSRDISPWFAEVPIIRAPKISATALAISKKASEEVHAAIKPGQRLLIEYKPFEPAFYHTDIADWGMA